MGRCPWRVRDDGWDYSERIDDACERESAACKVCRRRTGVMASLFAKMCPGSYDSLEIAARALLHAQMGCALLGTLGWQGTGYCAGVMAMSALGIAALETQNKALLKVRERAERTRRERARDARVGRERRVGATAIDARMRERARGD